MEGCGTCHDADDVLLKEMLHCVMCRSWRCSCTIPFLQIISIGKLHDASGVLFSLSNSDDCSYAISDSDRHRKKQDSTFQLFSILSSRLVIMLRLNTREGWSSSTLQIKCVKIAIGINSSVGFEVTAKAEF